MNQQTKRRVSAVLTGAVALALSTSLHAWGNSCEHKRELEERLDLSSSDSLSIVAAAGDLEIRGEDGAEAATVQATICASEEEWAEEADLAMDGGREARIAVVMPDANGMSWNNSYVYMDLVIVVPSDIELDVRDSSGDIEINRVASLAVKDSSGDLDIDTADSVSVSDSSGDIEINRVDGDVTIVQDSSGDIRGRDIQGSVIVARDSSGDIRFQDVGDDFVVERDSSGDVVARTIGGDFAVLRDGSGEVRYEDVAGSVDIPEGK
ncbi:MAG: DUF4097 family beta strand repeat-containing protein [Pseudomonadota bacterium]